MGRPKKPTPTTVNPTVSPITILPKQMMGWEVCQAFEQVFSSPLIQNHEEYKRQIKDIVLQNPDYAVWYARTIEDRMDIIMNLLVEHAVISLTGQKPRKGPDEMTIA